MESEESFARLVHGANPAATTRYPPTMDPFFDDDDLLDPPAFPMRSQESGLPLAHDPSGQPQGWQEDAFDGSASFPGVRPAPTPPARRRKQWRWPWDKPVVPTGERVIALNNPVMNDDFGDNFVSTSKYNPVSFLPKFLKGNSCHVTRHTAYTPTEQFSKYANIFFLFTACIQQIPNVSPTNQYTTIAPLAVVLLVSAFKEGQEDLVSSPLSPRAAPHSLPETTPI